VTTTPIKSLTLTAFRGASETFKLDFEPSKKLTIVYGENGAGKTTICDAFEVLAKGEAGSLKDKGIDATRHKYLNSAKKKPEDLSVALETIQGVACTGSMSGKNVVVTPETARPKLAIMRRKQMLEFVEATPGDRYKAIASFIDISAFEQSEANLKKLVGDLESEKTDAGKEVLGSYTALADVYASAGNAPGQDPVEWAAALLAQPEGNEAEEQAAVDMLVVQFQVLVAYPDQLLARQSAVTSAQSDFDTAQDAMAASAGAATASANELVAVLEAGQHYLEAHPDSEVCPLCESADRASGLANAVKDRLNQFEAVREAKTKLDKCRSTLEQANANLALLQTGYTENLTGYQSARTGFAWDQKYSFPESLPPPSITELQAWLDANYDLHGKWKDIEASLRQGKERRENASRALKRYNDNTAKVAELGALIPKLEQAHTLVKTQRQAFTNDIISEIAAKVGALYEQVHTGEGKDKIVLALDHAKRASIDLNAEFSGQDAPPQAYFSQSHLDTLGLCIFLALALREKPGETVLILDDVLGSVDEPHVDRVIEMICAVTKDFRHTLITTHYGPWRHKYHWGMIKGGHPCQFVQLVGSGLDGVIQATGSIPETERLRAMTLQQPHDLQAIVGKAGVVLEALLIFVAERYACRLPFKPNGKHALGDLLPYVKGKLRDELHIEIIESDGTTVTVKDKIQFKPILDEISGIVSVRNEVGAHFNTDGFDVPDAKALAFANHVMALADAMICPEHGWPTSSKSGSHWSNSGGTRRMHPLKEPK
jgi:energy-coupling factor transporter ATP-binding protein EcfA2